MKGIFMSTATLTTKGQVTIPAAVRASLGLETGSRIEFVEAENGQYLIVAATTPVQALKGLLRKPDNAVSVAQMKQVIAKSAAGIK
jgi:antitoxin PrlF